LLVTTIIILIIVIVFTPTKYIVAVKNDY